MARMNFNAKTNKKDYKFYVIVDGKIESGWEYQEDAKDQLGELPSGQKGKVLTKTGVQRAGINPDDDDSWTGFGKRKSSISEKRGGEVRNRITSRRNSSNIVAEITAMKKRLADMDSELLSDTRAIADEEVAIVEESTGLNVGEVEDQNERAMDNWPIEAREAVARRLIGMAKNLLEL